MRYVLFTNNNYSDPFLHSQLLLLYDQDRTPDRIYCKGEVSDKPNYVRIPEGIRGMMKSLLLMREELRQSEKTVFHLRGFVASFLFFLATLGRLGRVKYVFDPRGMFIEEQKEIKNWFGPVAFFLDKIEHSLVKFSLFTSVTTQRYKDAMVVKHEMPEKYEVVYNFTSLPFCKNRSISLSKPVVGYVGSINYWHDPEELLKLAKHILALLGGGVFRVYTQTRNHQLLKKMGEKINLPIEVGFVAYEEMGEVLRGFDIGLSVVRPTPTTRIASPIKISDYLAAGILIVTNADIGDFDEVYQRDTSALVYEFGNAHTITKEGIETIKPTETEEVGWLLSKERNRLTFFDRMDKELNT